MKRLIALSLVLAVAFAANVAIGKGDDKMSKEKMEMMKTEFSKCMICKNMVGDMDKLMPVMKSEFVKLNDGMAIVHTVSDPKMAEVLHKDCGLMQNAGMEAMKLSDADMKTQLCPMCQEIVGAAKAGATLSTGDTMNGSMLVLTSPDPALQTRLMNFQQKCVAMMGS